MGAMMKSEKNSLVLLSSKRTKADTRTRADEAFALPSFAESTPVRRKEMPQVQYEEVEMEHCSQSNAEIMKQTMLKHEAMFKEQVRELHRLYQVQRLLMAESRRKDSAIFSYSAPPSSSNSSSLSPFTTEPMKLTKGRNFWELTRDYKDFSCKQEQGSPFPEKQGFPFPEDNVGNRLPQDKDNSFEDPMKSCRKAERRTFDLERPAEEYMDDEVQEKKYQEDSALRKPISLSSGMHAGDKLEHQNEVQLSLGTGWIREVRDVNERGPDMLNPTSSLGKAVRESNSILKRPRCNEEIAFFPVSSVRNEGHHQEAPFHPAPISTKSLLGGLLGLGQESRLDDVSTSEWQKSSVDHEGKEGRQSLDLEAGERSTQENPKQPDWLLQDPTAVAKMSMPNSLTQNSGWHQTSPFFLQKQNMIDTNKALGEKGRPILFQEHSTSGSAWSSVVGLQQDPIFATGTQFGPASGEMVNVSMSQPASWKDGVDSQQHSTGMYMHHRHLTSTVPVDLRSQLPESQCPLQTQLLFHSGMNSGTCRGSLHDSTGRPWYQQHGLSTALQQHQQSVQQPAGFPLAGQETWPMPVHVGLVGVQQSTGCYESRRLDLAKDLRVKSINKVSHSTTNANSPPPVVPILSNLVDPLKQSYDLCSLDTTSDTELTLCPSSGKLMGKKCGENSDSSETQERDQLTACLQNKVLEVVKLEGSSLKVLDSQEAQSRKNQSMVISISALHFPYSGEIRAKETSEVLAQEVICSTTGSEEDAISTTAMLDQAIKVMTNGYIRREPADWEPVGEEFGSTIVVDEGPAVSKHRKPEENASEDQRQGGKASKESGQHHHAIDKEQVLQQMPQNGYKLPNHCQYPGAKKSDNGGEINLYCETYKNIDAYSKGSVTRDACIEALCNKAGTGSPEQEGESEACLGQKPGNFSSQSTLGANLSKSLLQNRGNITGMFSGEADPSGMQKVQFDLRDAEPPNLAGIHISHMDNLHAIENPETFFSVRSCNNDGLESSDDDQTNQAAEILLTLGSYISSGLERVKDDAACTPQRSLEWLANVIPREEDECLAAGLVHATVGHTQPPDTITFNGATHCKAFGCREGVVTPSEPDIEDEDQRSKDGCAPESLDFFESVTLMLKASGMTMDEQSQQVVEQIEVAGGGPLFLVQKGRSIRRGRIGKDFQKETLPSIASLSRQEITEDLQTIGGLMRSATEMVMRTSGILCSDDASNAPTGQRSMRSAAGAKGNGNNDVKQSLKDKENESFDGFPQISSWGDTTRRRRMRRHRSRWSLLASGTAAPLS